MPQPDPVEQSWNSPSRLSRRGFLVIGGAGIATAGAVAAQWFNILADNEGAASLSPAEAHRAALAGDVIMIDIRRPDEWATSGIGEGAVPIDMRRGDFTQAVLQAAGGDNTRPVALICARGVRSRHMARQMAEAGFTNVIDVPEGMWGSGAGPGWLASGLPVVAFVP